MTETSRFAKAQTPRGTSRRGQAGETLLESLLSILLLSIVGIAAFSGIQMALRASALHHQVAVSETLLRSAAENLQNPDAQYVPLAGCPGHGTYEGLPTRPGYGPMTAEVIFLSPETFEQVTTQNLFALVVGQCPGQDPGLQEIRLSITTPSGHTQRLEVLKGQP